MDYERDIRGAVSVVLHLLTAQREAVPGRPEEGPYPATVGEVADEIAYFVLDLETGPAKGVMGELMDRLSGQYAGLYPPRPGPQDPEVREGSNRPH